MKPPQKDKARDRGSATVELAILTPLVIGILLFVIACGRLVSVHQDMTTAAHAAARAATLTRDTTTAHTRAHTTATEVLSGRTACQGLATTIDTADFRAGGHVTVTITCTIPLADLALIAIPGTRTATATSTSPIDTWRAEP